MKGSLYTEIIKEEDFVFEGQNIFITFFGILNVEL